MSSDAKWSAPASVEFPGTSAGGGSEYVALPRFRDDVVARIHAWATGYGDGNYSGATATLQVSVNGSEIAAVEDSDFNLYSLQIERTIAIPAKTETKVEMSCSNHIATEAGDPAHGLMVTVESA
jgi:hypothetical protein